MSTQAEAYQYRIRELEGELTESRKQLSRVCRELRDERAVCRTLSNEVEKLERIKKVLRA